jgi:hypothetical protein
LKRSIAYVVIALALAAGAALVACGGGSNSSNDEKAQPTASQQQNGGNTPETKATESQATSKPSGGGSSGSIGSVPVYPGANKTSGGEWSGSEAAIPALGSSDVNAGDYKTVQYAIYETSDGAQEVLDWYKDKMGDWKNKGSFSGGEEGSVGAFGAWTKDDGKEAAWISVSEDSGTTTLSIFYGSQ